jgi:hypothetical protein
MKGPTGVVEAEVEVDVVVEETMAATKMIAHARWDAVQDQQRRPTFTEPGQSSKAKTTALYTLLLPVPNPKRQNKSRPTWR